MEKEIKEELAMMAMKNGRLEVNYRTGKALDQKEPERVVISGTINAPAEWISARHFDVNHAHVTSSIENGEIIFYENENNPYGTVIKGSLHESKEMKTMQINTYVYVTPQQMAERIKMNRSYFANRQEAMKLVSDLQNFKARVNKHIEDRNDNRGNRDLIYNQAVESNLPKAFTLNIPLFTGTSKREVECEVYINPQDLTCTLISAQATEDAESMKGKLMDEVLNSIKEYEEGLAIIQI